MIELDADQKTPLYEQLYAALADEIRTGQRAPGTPLPGRRTMAAQQGVSVNTVDAAYQMLAAEGLAEPRPRSGFYVQKTYGMLHSRARRAPAAPAPQPPAAPQPVYDLSTGSVDTALFPARSWGRIQKELLYQRPELLQRGEMQGDAPLRTQIAEYLSVYRGVECTPEQIVVGAGIEYLLGCLAHLFSDGMAAIENPGYFRTRTVLQNSGIPCTLVDIDREGLPADALEKSGANLCYLTPSHHFPTGVTMPATRRAQLLAWAAARPGRYILEDDYDSEFRFASHPLPAMQSMSPERVIYINSFSKSLAPSIRISYMVLPPALMEKFRRELGFYSCTVPSFEQYTLARFLSDGYFEKHINRMRRFYQKHRNQVIEALSNCAVSHKLTILEQDAGLHFLVHVDTQWTDGQLTAWLRSRGIRVQALSSFYHDNPPGDLHQLVVNYSGIDVEKLRQALEKLTLFE